MLWDVSLEVQPGEHTLILGPNGAGKSSLIRLLMLEDYPLSSASSPASVSWFGRSRWNRDELRRRLGVVTGDIDHNFARARTGRVAGLDVVVSGLTSSEGVFAHHDVRPAMWQAAREALERLEAGHLVSRDLCEMSAGEKRRVLIARALMTRPDVLLLDEPTAGLDYVAKRRFLEVLQRLGREGVTILMVTHQLEEMLPDTRRVLLLSEGRIVAAGPPTEVLTEAALSAIYGERVRVEWRGGQARLLSI